MSQLMINLCVIHKKIKQKIINTFQYVYLKNCVLLDTFFYVFFCHAVILESLNSCFPSSFLITHAISFSVERVLLTQSFTLTHVSCVP